MPAPVTTGATGAKVPPLGRYWREAAPKAPIDFPHMRRGATARFDNAKRSALGTWERLRHLIRPEFVHLAGDDGWGGPPREWITEVGVQASAGSVEYAAMWSAIGGLFPRRVLEIGGGYGGLARAGLRAGVTGWVIVDIPGVAECSRWYLREFGDRAKVIGPEEFADDPAQYDTVIQTRGFMEMSPEEIRFYFDRIQGGVLATGGVFFTINRFRKVSRLVEYPFDDKWSVLRAEDWPEGTARRGFGMLLLRREEVGTGEVAQVLSGWAGRT